MPTVFIYKCPVCQNIQQYGTMQGIVECPNGHGQMFYEGTEEK